MGYLDYEESEENWNMRKYLVPTRPNKLRHTLYPLYFYLHPRTDNTNELKINNTGPNFLGEFLLNP